VGLADASMAGGLCFPDFYWMGAVCHCRRHDLIDCVYHGRAPSFEGSDDEPGEEFEGGVRN
jgi:hypothetical protein